MWLLGLQAKRLLMQTPQVDDVAIASRKLNWHGRTHRHRSQDTGDVSHRHIDTDTYTDTVCVKYKHRYRHSVC